MIRFSRSQLLFYPLLMILDAIAIASALFLAYHVRFFSLITAVIPVTKGVPQQGFYFLALFFILPLWLFVFYQHGLYRVYIIPFIDEIIRITRSVTLATLFLVLATFFYREVSYSRATFILFWLFSIILVLSSRQLVKLFAGIVMRSVLGRETILVVGRENNIVRSIVKKQVHLQVLYHPYNGEEEIEKIKNLIQSRQVHQVIMVNHNWSENMLMSFYDWCEMMNVDLKMVPDIVQLCKGEISIDSSLGMPIYHLRSISFSGFNFYFKRIVDLAISITILAFIWPILLLIVIIIKLDSPGPFFYHHKRMGYRGQVFNFYKFRTMVTNADELLEKFKAQSERKGPVFKMANDPRVTRIGRFLRRYSIDEIPQLLNVLRGDMSLVGPRPQVLWEASAYDAWAKRRLRILPGITGLWQVSGRAALSYEEMIELDIFYIENWSCGLDLKILMKTLPAIFSKRGAY